VDHKGLPNRFTVRNPLSIETEASHAAWRTGPYRLIVVIAAAQTHFCCNAAPPNSAHPRRDGDDVPR
jgi:hypothetical protein